jgi:hypothetical protein
MWAALGLSLCLLTLRREFFTSRSELDSIHRQQAPSTFQNLMGDAVAMEKEQALSFR